MCIEENHMFKNFLGELSVLFSYPKHLMILAVRLMLAYGFSKPALLKLSDITATAKWFESISIPFYTFLAYVVSMLETLGIVLLILGLFTRQIAFLLACVMVGAIFFVHLTHGFSVANNGIEIPLYYLLFLFVLASYGGGKYSFDNFLFKDGNQ
ncbi:MAG: DoxX family protein [uncultured Sulfurovum sp.]|uniref:DoxX family protein n=1 Tax=uncultured Sulfurovum sp. TaxID=269237 RepID=A0A6S6S6W1_9BACT|nr:MAG: DoxX family protein [uncultured Sulfurovum sp.]